MKRIALTLTGIALGASLLTGCGGNETGGAGGNDSANDSGGAADDVAAYCRDLEAARDSFGSLQGPGAGRDVEAALDDLHALAEQAPAEVEEEWRTVDDLFIQYRQALDEAGVTFKDLDGLREGKMPKGVDAKELTKLGEKLQAIDSSGAEQAREAIEKHAKSECGIELAQSPSPSE